VVWIAGKKPLRSEIAKKKCGKLSAVSEICMKFRQNSQAVMKNEGLGYNRKGYMTEERRLNFKMLP